MLEPDDYVKVGAVVRLRRFIVVMISAAIISAAIMCEDGGVFISAAVTCEDGGAFVFLKVGR